jgi:hypothetical protein
MSYGDSTPANRYGALPELEFGKNRVRLEVKRKVVGIGACVQRASSSVERYCG